MVSQFELDRFEPRFFVRIPIRATLYLGHAISNREIEIDYDKVCKVRQWLRPQTIRDMRSFSGFTRFFHRFIMDYATIALPLTNVPKGVKKKCSHRKSPPENWTNEMNESFETLK